MNSNTVSDPLVTPVVLQVNVTNIISYRTVNICSYAFVNVVLNMDDHIIDVSLPCPVLAAIVVQA
jgi:hypothetical protein